MPKVKKFDLVAYKQKQWKYFGVTIIICVQE